MISKNQFPLLIASDHAGFDLKKSLIENLTSEGYKVVDLGCKDAQNSVDYPDYAKKLCLQIIDKKANRGILICGSGIGISIAANRYKEIRAALCLNQEMAKLARQHNDANVIALGARLTSENEAIKAVKTFLTTDFEGGRHDQRVTKLSQ